MPKSAEDCHVGRCPAIIPVSISLERDAWTFAQQQAISRKAVGRYLSRLVYEERARQEERQRIAAALQTALQAID